MTLRKKLLEAAAKAAEEATENERARCLWCLDKVVQDTEKMLSNKLLSEAQLHLVKVKLEIAAGVSRMVRVAIVSGARPSRPAGFSSERDAGGE